MLVGGAMLNSIFDMYNLDNGFTFAKRLLWFCSDSAASVVNRTSARCIM